MHMVAVSLRKGIAVYHWLYLHHDFVHLRAGNKLVSLYEGYYPSSA